LTLVRRSVIVPGLMETAARQPILRQLRALPAPVWVLFGGTYVNRFGAFVMPMLAIYLTRQGYGVAKTGVAIGVYGAGHLCASLLGGHLADRIGRRYTIALSMFSSGLAMLGLSQAQHYGPIVVWTFLAGTTTELYRPAASALIGDLVTSEQRVIAFGMYRFAVNLGFATGPAVAGFLADRSFFYVFLGDALTSFCYGTIALLALPHGLRTYSKHEEFGAATRHALQNRLFLIFLAAATLAAAIDFQMGSTFALYVRLLGYPPSTYGMLISINGVLIILFEIVITSWASRQSPRPIIALGFALNGIGFGLTGFAHSVPALAATVVIWTLGEMLSSPVAVAYATGLAPERYRGRYMGLFIMAWSVGMIAGPTLGTVAFAHSPNIVWASCLVIGLISAGLAAYSPRPR
jgi:MFS family permease